MQSNLYSEDPLFNYWNEFDGGPTNYPPPLQPPHHPPPPPMMGPQFDNGSYNFVPPLTGIPMPMGPMIPGPCPPNPSMMGPIHRGYPRYTSPLAALQAIPPPMAQPQPPPPIIPSTHHFNFQPQPPQQPPFPVGMPPVPVPVPVNLEPVVERPVVNDGAAPAEEVVVKNGQVFHISFIDDPAEPPANNPTPASEDADNDEERDWINYDELPLLKHVSGSEVEDGVFKCGICAKELKSALNLYVHEQTHKTTRLDCKTCGKRFNRIGKLEHHMRRHHSDPTPEKNASPNSSSSTPILTNFNHYCVECEEFFPSQEDFETHMERTHRLVDDANCPKGGGLKKSIGCPYCEETFEWPCLLKTHMTKHTGEKPFICERCNVSFRFVQSFYRHNRRVHGIDAGPK